MKYIQFPWRFLGSAVFALSLCAGAMGDLFKNKYKVVIVATVVLLPLLLNFSFFTYDIWYSVADSYFTTGAEWDRQRTASIGDFWPEFGHKIPDKPSDGTMINFFPGWNKTPDENGLIEASGATFKDTPVRRVGNIISLTALFGVIIYLIWRKKVS